ncbi:uncharacterized protein LOC128345841 [Hemicordylus capensis]|uniref:uncharacterized protein LOC128345841 n=1 Tax=Hemicordylus capensis TaxID=884348 RepID=UPI002304C47E|nr:uncharacterized protein LOC128345841 [Hemicordylus capensis]
MCLGEQKSGSGAGAAISQVAGRGRYGGGSWAGRYWGNRSRQLRPVPFSGPSPNPLTLGSSENTPSRIRVLLLNARSVNAKTSLIHDLIVDEHADLVCVTETWLDALGGVGLSQLCPPGFQIVQQPRLEGRGVGVAVIFRETIPVSRCPVRQSQNFECLSLRVGLRDRLGILLVYRPPRCTSVSLPELAGVVSEVALGSSRLIVLGDFNVHAEAPLVGAAQDFMASMATMGLSQLVSGPTHVAGHTMDLVFADREINDLEVGEFETTPLSWTDHHLVGFSLTAPSALCRGGGPIKMVRPRRLMDPLGFQTALGEFPVSRAGDPVDALVDLWNGEMAQAVDTVARKRPLRLSGARSAPWFSSELRAMKQLGRRLERRWRKSRHESNRTRARTHFRDYAVAVGAAKKHFFSASIASAQCRQTELFRVVKTLLHTSPRTMGEEPSTALCDRFACHFADKVARIRADLDSRVLAVPADVPLVPSGPVVLDSFRLVRPEDVDKILGSVRATSCALDPCPSWLIKAAREGTGRWLEVMVNA